MTTLPENHHNYTTNPTEHIIINTELKDFFISFNFVHHGLPTRIPRSPLLMISLIGTRELYGVMLRDASAERHQQTTIALSISD
jgi:hypothetical protein